MRQMFKSLSSSLLAAGILAGCGAAPTAQLLTSTTGETSAFAKKTGHGLGCKLEGLKKLSDDGGYEVQASLPEKVDLRANCSPIADQGMSNACVAFSSVHGLGEYLLKKQGRYTELSPRFIWNLCRKQDKSLNENVGTWPHEAMKIIDNIGLVPESSFPFPTLAQQKDEKKFAAMYSEVPSSTLIAQAKKTRPYTGWVEIKTVRAMKKSISEGMPVVFAIAVYPSISQSNSTGIIPMPKANEECEGGHAIVCVGYDNAKKLFIIRNSWGTSWGDKGYGYLPYDFVKAGLTYEGFTAKQ